MPLRLSSRDLFGMFEAVALSRPTREMILFAGGRAPLSASVLLERAAGVAGDLGAEGVSPGDVVLLDGLEGAAFVPGALAVWARGAVALGTEPGMPPRERDAMVQRFGPCASLCPVERGPSPLKIRREPARRPIHDLPAGTAVIKLSSGSSSSSGRPRGIAVTADQLLADARRIIQAMEVGPEDVNVGAIPLSHSYGLGNLMMPLVMQGTRLLLAPAGVPALLAAALSIDRPAIFPGVPYLFEILSRPDGPQVTPRGLRTCVSAAAPLRAPVAAAFKARHGVPVRSFYGCSEAGGIAYDASPFGDAGAAGDGLVGEPLPGVDVAIEGEGGRVVVRSDSVAAGYMGPEGPRDEADGQFHDGAFRTGDTARLVERAGRRELCLTGRVGAGVNVAGVKIDPRGVERAVIEMDGVLDAAAVGYPDEARGESLAVCLVAGPAVTRHAVLAHLRPRLSARELPRRIVFLTEIPRNERGKLDRRALQRELLAEVARAPGGRG